MKECSLLRSYILACLLVLLLVACGERDPSPDATPVPPDSAAVHARVHVPSAGGVFHLDASTLAPFGWTPATPLHLTQGGEPWPLVRIDGELVFYAPPRHNPYSEEQVFWLEAGTAGTMDVPTGAEIPADAGTTVRSEHVLEENHLYHPQAFHDPWFWQKLVAPTDVSFPLPLQNRVASEVTVRVYGRGVTTGDHRLLVRLNDATIADESWSGSENYDVAGSMEASPEGDLTLTLEMPAPENGVDILLLDRIVVQYDRRARVTDGALRFTAPADGTIDVEIGETPAIVWHVQTDTLEPVPTTMDGNRVLFTAKAGETYVAADPRQPAGATPAVVRVEDPDAVKAARPSAEYVVVAPEEFWPALEPLLEARRAGGMSTYTVTPQMLYDGFSHGEVEPLAIRDFLRYARDRWSVPPRFVLLVGDATYDPFGYLGETTPNVVPSPFVDTVFGGQTVSDNMLADLDKDGYPDIALGRIPAGTPEQVERVVEKILAYQEQREAGTWQNRVVFVADGAEAQFRTASEKLHDVVPARLRTVPFYPEDDTVDTEEMASLLNEGALLVNYVGHGSVNRWGKAGLLTSEEANKLHNGKQLPIYVNMTCLTGLFTHPQQVSLAESLLWAEQGGAVAVLAPTSLTLPNDQTQLNEALLDAILSGTVETIGEAVVVAKQELPMDSDNARDVIATFNLLGDPALRPVRPSDTD